MFYGKFFKLSLYEEDNIIVYTFYIVLLLLLKFTYFEHIVYVGIKYKTIGKYKKSAVHSLIHFFTHYYYEKVIFKL